MTSSGANVSHYRVTAGLDHDVIPAEWARAMWDQAGEDQRSGEREAAFILWIPNRSGWRGSPIIFKPLVAVLSPAA